MNSLLLRWLEPEQVHSGTYHFNGYSDGVYHMTTEIATVFSSVHAYQ